MKKQSHKYKPATIQTALKVSYAAKLTAACVLFSASLLWCAEQASQEMGGGASKNKQTGLKKKKAKKKKQAGYYCTAWRQVAGRRARTELKPVLHKKQSTPSTVSWCHWKSNSSLWLVPPRCNMKCFRRSVVPTAIGLYNTCCADSSAPNLRGWCWSRAPLSTHCLNYMDHLCPEMVCCGRRAHILLLINWKHSVSLCTIIFFPD